MGVNMFESKGMVGRTENNQANELEDEAHAH